MRTRRESGVSRFRRRLLSPASGVLACLLISVACLGPAGCVSTLDRQIQLVRQEKHQADRLFVEAVRAFESVAGEMAGKKHELQDLAYEREWSSWLDRHTSVEGGLVSTDDSGAVIPMPREQLERAMAQRAANAAKLVESREGWAQAAAGFDGAVVEFAELADSQWTTEQEVQQARESAQALVDRSITVIAGLASGFGLGLGI